jgi:predicted enzyme related to lactoylglutathione lyase
MTSGIESRAPAGALAGRPAFSGFSTDDIPASKAFYGEKLGVDVSEDDGMLSLDFPGGQRVIVYPKDDHEPASFTVLNFEVDDIDAAVDGLVAAGVGVQRYGPEFEQDERGIARMEGDAAIAWFQDPAGNILSVIQGAEET